MVILNIGSRDAMVATDAPLEEHGVLLRHLAKLQDRVTRLLNMKEAEVTRLQGEILRLRGELLVLRTATLWGMVGLSLTTRRRHQTTAAGQPRADADNPSMAHEVLCRTACTGHAHFWLTQEGQCQRTGLACDKQDT